MTEPSYNTSFTVAQPPETVLAAIVNVRDWWSDSVEGATDRVGVTWRYQFRDIHRAEIKTVELKPGRVVWHVVANDFNFIADKTEWVDTHIVFDITRTDDETHVRFTHVGLTADQECYEICENAWGTYIGSLKSLITSGVGFPNRGEPVTQGEKELVS